jgi:ParB family transcriptional regulator, chromosome partitioning protein
VSRILDPNPDRELDDTLVFSIAESARTIGFLHPIAVRKGQVEGKSRTVLVAGAHRLAAARHLGYERIECVFVDYGDDTSVQLVQVGEDLFRKHVTVLRHAELVAKWYELVSKDDVYGQVDRKNKRGRPPSGVSRVARDLPLGTSVEARRKMIERARRIARIQPEAKQAAISVGLDDNQQALLAIAAANGRKAQLRKVAKLTTPSDEQQDTGGAAKPETDGSEAADGPESQRRRKSVEPSHPETSFEQLEELWQKEFRELWTYAPFEVRERFISMLRRARSKAPTDSVRFVKDVFQGREVVYARDLYALAKSRGVSKGAVQMALKVLGHPRKRKGYWSFGQYYYRNINRDWKEELRIISDSELVGRRQSANRAGADTNTTRRDKEDAVQPESGKVDDFWPLDDYLPS